MTISSKFRTGLNGGAPGGIAAGGDSPEGVSFDGSTDYLTLAPTISSGGSYVTHSFFIYLTNDIGMVFKKTGVEIEIYSGKIAVKMGGGIQSEYTVDMLSGSYQNRWTHVLIYSTSSKNDIYLNETLLTSLYDSSSYNVAWGGSHEIMLGVKGRLAHFVQEFAQRDYSVESNRRLFIDADGKPADGQASLNPSIYLPMTDAATAHVNEGTGGDFTVNGVLDTAGRGANQFNCSASALTSADYLSKSISTT